MYVPAADHHSPKAGTPILFPVALEPEIGSLHQRNNEMKPSWQQILPFLRSRRETKRTPANTTAIWKASQSPADGEARPLRLTLMEATCKLESNSHGQFQESDTLSTIDVPKLVLTLTFGMQLQVVGRRTSQLSHRAPKSPQGFLLFVDSAELSCDSDLGDCCCCD